MSNSSDLNYLRPEAQPVGQWDQLTQDQKAGLLKLLGILKESVERKDSVNQSRQRRLPWLITDSKMQLAFVNGHRGTGKTTLMTTLVDAIDAPHAFTCGRTPADAEFHQVKTLAAQLQHHIVPVQPLDMEPLPPGTPLMAAILARVYRAARTYGDDYERSGRGLLAEDPREQRELLRFEQYQERVARALDSNLEARKGSLDAEQFAESRMIEEDNRLALVSDLELVLSELSKRVQERLNRSSKSSNPADNKQLIFLVPIDDIDLNPQRCLELLRLLRTFSPPRELFFLLMGQFELVESIVKLQMASEFGGLWAKGSALSTESETSLKNELAAVSAANVRKLIPVSVRIELPEMSLPSALDFRPLNSMTTNKSQSPKPLKQIFEEIKLRDSKGKPSRIQSLAALLSRWHYPETGLDPHVMPRSVSDFKWNQYCGVGTFQVPARRLVDLWMELHQLTIDLTAANQKLDELDRSDDLTGKTKQREKIAHCVHDVLRQHWKRAIDADPLLSTDARRRLLQDDGMQACAVVEETGAVFDRDLEIEGAAVSISAENSTQPPVIYRARLRFAELRAGTGVPAMALLDIRRGRADSTSSETGNGTGTGPSSKLVPIEHIQTRCAKVLYHDIEELFLGSTTASNDWQRLTSVQPIETVWVGPAGEVTYYPWPVPPLTTFVEMSEFLANWRAYCESACGLNYLSSSATATINPEAVALIVQRWVFLGLKAIEANLQDTLYAHAAPLTPLADDAGWQDIADRLLALREQAKLTNHLHGWIQIDKWLRRIAQLVQPELCSPSVSRILISKIEGLSCGDKLRQLTNETRGMLLRQRHERLDSVSQRGADDLRNQLNRNPNPLAKTDQWLFIAVEETVPEKRPEVLAKLEALEGSVDQIRREQMEGFKKSEFLTLSRQGELAMEDDPNTAVRLFQQAQEVAETISRSNPGEISIQRGLSRLLRNLADIYLRQGKLDEAENEFRESLTIARKLAESEPQNKQAQRELSVSLDKTGEIHLLREQVDEAEKAFQESLTIDRKLAEAEPQNKQAQRDLSVSLTRIGDLHLLREQEDEAEKAFLEALTIARKLAESDQQNKQSQGDLRVSAARIGGTPWRREQVDETENEFQASLTMARKLAEAESQNKQAQRDLSASLTRIGDIYWHRKQMDEAEKAFQEALAIDRKLAESEPQNKQAQRDLSFSLSKICDIHLRREQVDEAEKAFQESLTIARKLAESEPQNKQSQRDLWVSLNRIGEIHLLRERVDEAEKAFQEALTTARKLADSEPQNKQSQRDLSFSLSKIGDIHLRREQVDEAEKAFQEALTTARKLADSEPQDKQAQRELSVSLTKIGDIYLLREQVDEAEKAFQEALAIARKLAESEPQNKQSQRDLWVSLNRIGEIHLLRERVDEAEKAFQEALTTARKLAESEPQNKRAQRDLSASLSTIGEIHLLREQVDEAEKAFQESLTIDRKLAESDPQSKQVQRDLWVSLHKIGDIHLRREQLDEAEKAFQQSLTIARKLAESEPQNKESQRDLSVSLNRIGDIQLRREQVNEAEKAFQESLAIDQKLAESDPQSKQAQRDLSISLDKIGEIHLRREQVDEAEKVFQESLTIARKLAELEPQNKQAQRDLSVSLARMGEIHWRRKKLTDASAAFKEALAIAIQLFEGNPESDQAARDVAKYECLLAKTLKSSKNRHELRSHAWSILSRQDLGAIHYDPILASLYEDLKLEFGEAPSTPIPPRRVAQKKSSESSASATAGDAPPPTPVKGTAKTSKRKPATS